MNEKDVYRVLMWALAAVTVIAGLGAVGVLIYAAGEGWSKVPLAILLGAAAVGGGAGVTYFASRVKGHEKVFSNPIEQEVLNNRQRRELRLKRGELVMQRSLIEIENERDNIIHREIEAANDPNKPPHQTRFGDDEVHRPEVRGRIPGL